LASLGIESFEFLHRVLLFEIHGERGSLVPQLYDVLVALRFDLQRFEFHRLYVLPDAPQRVRVTQPWLSLFDLDWIDHAIVVSNVRATNGSETSVYFGTAVLKNDQICSLADKTRRELETNPLELAARQILDAKKTPPHRRN
jgi:hypothetical protein